MSTVCPHCKKWNNEKPLLDRNGNCPICKNTYTLPHQYIGFIPADKEKENDDLIEVLDIKPGQIILLEPGERIERL